LLCAILVWRYVAQLKGTEFSGGRITGPLLDMSYVGILLFVLALILSFLRTRLSAATTLAASLLALPVFLYFAGPGPFRRIFKGEYSVPSPANFVWDISSVVGIAALLLASLVSLRNLIAFRSRAKS
jgi:hypothetical protein